MSSTLAGTPATAPAVPAHLGSRATRATYGVMALALVLAAGDLLWVATTVHLPEPAHQWVLFAHLAALTIGFGAVLAVDWVAFLWLTRRRSITDLLALAGTLSIPIWGGYGALVLTGVLLEPDPTRTATAVKLGLALLIGLNGLAATALHRVMVDNRGRWPIAGGAVCALVSQCCWWGAAAIGFINAH